MPDGKYYIYLVLSRCLGGQTFKCSNSPSLSFRDQRLQDPLAGGEIFVI